MTTSNVLFLKKCILMTVKYQLDYEWFIAKWTELFIYFYGETSIFVYSLFLHFYNYAKNFE